jgi:hypothetical protein
MAAKKDDWAKPRGVNGHFSPDEIALVRRYFDEERPVRAVARELQCSSRVIQKYYAQFRGHVRQHRRVARPSRAGLDSKPAPAAPVTPRPSRFYKSDFEL